MKKLIIFKIKMVDSSPEIKNQPTQTLEIIGYWSPNESKQPEKKNFFDPQKNIKVEILSQGILGTPKRKDEKTGIKIQDYYHITESGQVVRVTWKKYSEFDRECSIDIIGSNGRIKTPENPDPKNPNLAKLIYEPRVVIE